MEAVEDEVTEEVRPSVLLSLRLVATVEAIEVVEEPAAKCLPPPDEDDRRTGGGGRWTTSEATASISSSFSNPEAGGMGELITGGGVALRGSGTLKH